MNLKHVINERKARGDVPHFCHIQIDCRTPISSPLLWYTFCTQVPRHTIWPSGSHVSWGTIVTLILKPIRLLSILSHFMESLSRILALAVSRNLHFLVIVYCARHLHTSFKVCNDQGLMLKIQHATVQTVIKNQKARLTGSKLCFEYFATCKQCPEFHDIQFVYQNAPSQAWPSTIPFNT